MSKKRVNRPHSGKPRKRPRLTMRKRRELPLMESEGSPGVPNEAEFAAMTPYWAFTVRVDAMSDSESESGSESASETGSSTDSVSSDARAKRHAPRLRVKRAMFKKGDCVLMHSVKDCTNDAWLGRIERIAQDELTGKVWIKVHWYYSRNDLDFIKTFERGSFAPCERALDEHAYNLQTPYAFLKSIVVHEWDEASLNPPDLTPTSFFCRSLLHSSRKCVEPRIGLYNCLCHEPFNPFPDHSNVVLYSGHNIMHFCARPECATWYHESCLTKHGFADTNSHAYRGDFGVRLLASNPDTTYPCAILSDFATLPGDAEDVCGLEEGDTEDVCEPEEDEAELDLASVLAKMDRPVDILSHLPSAIITIAQSPIVRRPGPAKDGWSPVGNVAEVVLARRLVYAAFENMASARGYCSQEIEALLRDVDAIRHEALLQQKGQSCLVNHAESEWEDATVTDMMYNLCERIERSNDAILASPYVPYWERRAQEIPTQTWLHRPSFVCPQCGGAI